MFFVSSFIDSCHLVSHFSACWPMHLFVTINRFPPSQDSAKTPTALFYLMIKTLDKKHAKRLKCGWLTDWSFLFSTSKCLHGCICVCICAFWPPSGYNDQLISVSLNVTNCFSFSTHFSSVKSEFSFKPARLRTKVFYAVLKWWEASSVRHKAELKR